VENDYNLNIPEWVNAIYSRIFVYDDAQVNVLEEALPPQMNNTSKRIKTD